MYIHTFTCFCESQWRFFSLLSLKYLYISFFSFSPCSLPAAVFPSSTLQAQGHPCPSLLPPFLPSLRLSSAPPACRVIRGCRAVCPLSFSPFVPIGHAPKLSGGLPSCLLCLVVLCWLPSLVRHQAQNAMTVGADAACICPRPCLLLPAMCCRVFRCSFRGFRPCVRVCVLLPCVVWWQ